MFWKKKKAERLKPVKVNIHVGETMENRVVFKIDSDSCKVVGSKTCYFLDGSMVFSINSNLVLIEEFNYE